MRSTKRKTLEEFIADAIKKHGDKYDYSLIKEYVNNKTPVPIKCNRCGEVFWQKPNAHLNGNNCPYCWAKKKPQFGKRKPLYGIGILDINTALNEDEITEIAYKHWQNMFERCYSKSYQKHNTSYIGCVVDERWHKFSAFKEWFEKNYKKGYVLDKDILGKGAKTYSPEMCCMIPQSINAIIVTRTKKRNRFGKGISITPQGKYIAFLRKYNKTHNLGHFDTIEEAFEAFKKGKMEYVKEVADTYYKEGKITKEVYDALYKYEPKFED